MRTTTSQSKIYRARRTKLATFLRSGAWVEDHFDIATWTQGDPGDLPRLQQENKTGCETTACLAGFCPLVFPQSWEWAPKICAERPPKLRKGGASGEDGHSSVLDFSNFFGLDLIEAEILCTEQPEDTPAAKAADLLEAFNAV